MIGPKFVAGLAVLLSAPAWTDDAPDEVDTIVVTGSRSTDLIAEIPNTTTVIQLEALEARNAISVPDA